MSKSDPTPTNKPSEPPPKKSAKSSTPETEAEAGLKSVLASLHKAVEIIETSTALNERLLAREKPLVDFHQAVAGASESDIRMYWDIRLVRGEDIPFTRSTGVSSMPGMLSEKLKAHGSAQIQQEVNDKIGSPLGVAFMEECDRLMAGPLKRMADRRLVEPPRIGDDTATSSGPSQILGMAQAHERDTEDNSSDYEDEEEEDHA